MSDKHRILLQTNPTWVKTGLSENAKTLLKYLYKTGKYDLGHYCTQATSSVDPRLKLTPWKSYGCIPPDQRVINEINSDPGKQHDAMYGSYNIDNVVKDFKPTIWIGSDDIWSFPSHAYGNKPWFKQINSIMHITVDSVPVLEQAYEQARLTKHFFTWAKFAMNEMHRVDPQYAHVNQIYGATDITKFSPITDAERTELRKRFNITPETVVFLFVGRNQLRKQFVSCLEAFAKFKKDHPQAQAKLHFHTAFHEQGQGWNIPKMAQYYGVNMNDVLATYSCKTCGQWHVAPFIGEDINCPYCGSQKSMITVTILNGVPDDQMRYIYGISDACISAFSSGGQEYHNSQSLLCGKPLACTNYSCGEDFCSNDIIYPLGYESYHEPGNNFIKSTTNKKDIKTFMVKVWKSSHRDLVEWGEKGREWATKTFSIEAIGAQWERLFDAIPRPDWSTITLTQELKNEKFPFPEVEDENKFIHALYKEILKMNEPEQGSGFLSWKEQLKRGVSRRNIYDYFIGEARKENEKVAPQTQDFWSFIDKTTGRKRLLYIIKESLGDCLISTQLFKSAREQYPDHDIYVATKLGNFEMFLGNPYIYRLIPYVDAMEQEMVMIGAGQSEGYFDVYMHPGIPTQRQLDYLSMNSIAYDLNLT